MSRYRIGLSVLLLTAIVTGCASDPYQAVCDE